MWDRTDDATCGSSTGQFDLLASNYVGSNLCLTVGYGRKEKWKETQTRDHHACLQLTTKLEEQPDTSLQGHNQRSLLNFSNIFAQIWRCPTPPLKSAPKPTRSLVYLQETGAYTEGRP